MSEDINRLESLIELAMMLGQSNDFDEVLRIVTQKAMVLLNADTALVMMINPNTRQTIKTVYAEGKEDSHQHHHVLNQNISGWVIKNNRALISNEIKNDPRFRLKKSQKLDIHSALCVPLRVKGITIGTLLALSALKKKAFAEDDLTFLEQLASVVSPHLRNLQKIQEYFTPHLPEQVLLDKYKDMGLIGKSPRFIELLKSIEAAACCDVRVLLEGDSGTGKELIARAIHRLSSRSSKQFIAIDCAAIPENLIESELFGHIKGAFTGAAGDRKGLMEEADGGTLFMDEISNLPIEIQSKLLRVLQEGEIRPLGSNKTKQVNVRIISASSGSLRDRVAKNLFREDLYFRLHVYPVKIPSLNERIEDIPLLAHHFLKIFSQQQKKALQSIHEELIDFMAWRVWTGNIRELENFMERMVTLVPDNRKILEPDTLPDEFKKEWTKIRKKADFGDSKKSLNEHIAQYEEQLIRQALHDHNWNQSRAARALNISEQTIRYKMNKLGIVKLEN